MGGEYKELIVDISKKEDVYKAADHIRETMGDVSIFNWWLCYYPKVAL